MRTLLSLVLASSCAAVFANPAADVERYDTQILLARADNVAGDQRRGRGADDSIPHKRRGADDAAGHVRGGGADDPIPHKRRGADDPAGDNRRGRGADDPVGHA